MNIIVSKTFPFMVRYLTMNGKSKTWSISPAFALRYRRVKAAQIPVVGQPREEEIFLA
jgi:hypothetical protein